MRGLIKDTPMIDREREIQRKTEKREKSPAPGGIRTHNLSVTRHVLQHLCTTAEKKLKIMVHAFMVVEMLYKHSF